MQPRVLARRPRIPDVAEYRDRQLVDSQRQMTDRFSHQRERHPVFGAHRGGSPAAQGAGAIAAHRKRARCAEQLPESQRERAGRDAADRQEI